MKHNEPTSTEAKDAPKLIAWHLADRGEGRTFWTRIGAAWPHSDGEGFSLQLNFMSLDGGRLVLRSREQEVVEG